MRKVGWDEKFHKQFCLVSRDTKSGWVENQNGLVSKYYVSSVKTVGPLNFWFVNTTNKSVCFGQTNINWKR